MKAVWAVLLVWCSGAAHAQATWFNLMGDPADETVNTIDVDPSPVSIDGAQRVMRLRVSRSTDRVNWDGVLYRSYVAEVLIDCLYNTAHYQIVDYFSMPGWKNAPHRRMVYSQSDLRPMRFRDVVPNPTERIIRAACRTSAIITN